ncbi:hypothetical protein ElyMa_004595800 [Elysia marginata]|uniref:Uncharacterized protein n=1 Tax=Elysia marginata TaxID=1093978 RepID=A0AAV4HXR7_9GAST|nr:hypothetical protein ElyMa_004595800 [Elysia marginata]
MTSSTRSDHVLRAAIIIILSCVVPRAVSAVLKVRDGDGAVCMLVDANFTIQVTANKDGQSVRQTSLEDFTLNQGRCGDSTATLSMNSTVGEDTSFQFEFKKVGISVNLRYRLSFFPADLFPKLPGQSDFAYKGYISKERRISSYKSSFKCTTEHSTQLTYDPASTSDEGPYKFTVQLTMKNIRVQAFNVKDGKFSSAYRCLADSNRHNLSTGVVVLIVLCVVLPLVLTAVAVVVVLRRNKVGAAAALDCPGWWRKILPKQ